MADALDAQLDPGALVIERDDDGVIGTTWYSRDELPEDDAWREVIVRGIIDLGYGRRELTISPASFGPTIKVGIEAFAERYSSEPGRPDVVEDVRGRLGLLG